MKPLRTEYRRSDDKTTAEVTVGQNFDDEGLFENFIVFQRNTEIFRPDISRQWIRRSAANWPNDFGEFSKVQAMAELQDCSSLFCLICFQIFSLSKS